MRPSRRMPDVNVELHVYYDPYAGKGNIFGLRFGDARRLCLLMHYFFAENVFNRTLIGSQVSELVPGAEFTKRSAWRPHLRWQT